MNNKFVFSIAVVLCIVSLSASLISGMKLWELAPTFVVVLSSLALLKQRSNSLK